MIFIFTTYPAEHNDQSWPGHGQLPKWSQQQEDEYENEQHFGRKADDPVVWLGSRHFFFS
jgi:hypothetical protein